MDQNTAELAKRLRHRLSVIADHELRDTDPDEQLKQLQAASEAIDTHWRQMRRGADRQLAHYVGNCSYDKALAWIETGE